MNLPNFHTLCGYHHTLIDALGSACLKCIPSCLRRHRQVHPVLLHNDNCEFLQLHPQRRIRVIHFNPADELDCVDNAAARKCEEEVINPHEDSATDDYWFIRCSHSSFRLLKKKARDQRSRSPEITDNTPALNNVRYSFHRRKKLKSCIEEDAKQSNQKTSVDAVVNSLLSTVLVEAVAEAASLLQKHQRCHPANTSVECLPQHSVTNQTVNNKQLHNGKPAHHLDEVNLELSGCVNQVFTSDEKEMEEKEQSSNLKSESQFNNKTSLNENNSVSQEEQVEIRVKKESGKGTKSKKSSLNYNSKPVLLFLHGAGSSAEVWSHLLAYFATAGYEVIAPDLLGHGFSSTPGQRGAYTFACLLQDALQIFDTFITEPRKCVIIGHAYGCSFAAAVARYRPQSVVQLVLISGGGPTPLAPYGGIYALPRCLLGCAKPLLLCGFRREYFYAARGKQLVFENDGASEVPAYVLENVRQGQTWPQGDSAFHRRIQVPTLLVHGINDPYITLVEECEMERTIPRSFLEVVPGAGHWSMLEAPQQLCHMLHCFITLWDKAGALSK